MSNSLTVSLDHFGIKVTPEQGIVFSSIVSAEQVKEAAQYMFSVSKVNEGHKVRIDQYLGQLILQYAAMTDTTWTEAISNLDLVQNTGKGFRTLIKLPRIVATLPEEVFQLPLTPGHFEAVTMFGGPKDDPEALGRFNQGRVAILEKAAEDPVERNRTWVTNEMKKLQQDFGVARSRKTPLNDLRKAFEDCSQALLEWRGEDYLFFDVTRAQLRDRWQGYRDELIERGHLSEDCTNPVLFTLPWKTQSNEHGKTIEAEVVSVSSDNEPTEADADVRAELGGQSAQEDVPERGRSESVLSGADPLEG